MNQDFNKITQTLNTGGIAVVRTDTLYGIIAKASNETAVEKVFKAKKRQPSKQCIILLASAQDAPAYTEQIAQYSEQSEAPTSVIVPASTEPSWLLRGGDSVAYRVVRDPFLKSVVAAVGPVIAPSANPESLAPAQTIEQARSYFGNHVQCYIDGGEVPLTVSASQIIQVQADGTISTIRSR